MSTLMHRRDGRVRSRRVRARLRPSGRPRLSVFRSNRHLWAQIIDDAAGRTLVAASDRDLASSVEKQSPVARAQALGRELARRARARGITAVVFDRGRYRYLGAVAALARGAREGGLEF